MSLQYQSTNPTASHLPKSIYYVKYLVEWVQWLLLNTNIESLILEWKQQLLKIPHANDIQQAQEWKTFQWKNSDEDRYETPQHKISLFIDWLNPRGNKQAGKQESMVLILLTCLNLPPNLRHKPAHLFFFWIVPGPNFPRTITFSKILKPLVHKL
ncbi:hypothetical protein O181_060788 [Austropuccinia psidii MF-1]|uniref:Uncharacterized protein n=1 Tax=Austropuccinia psidii MF-1 TaxID=1389203 RepID=A0A9Q3EH15_9BASI|nr:hypothetical protein [Austropuccinia psidii MF-1]